MFNLNDQLGLFLNNSEKEIDLKRFEIAEKLNLFIDEPEQNKRIEALFNLLKKCLYKSDTEAFLYQKIIDYAEKLILIKTNNLEEIEKIKKENNVDFFKVQKAKNIKQKNVGEIDFLEKKLFFYKRLLSSYQNKLEKNFLLDSETSKYLKKIDEKCFDYWLKMLDVNYELRNTIIGYINRLSSYKISKAYIDYQIFLERQVNKTFDKIQVIKVDSIQKFYDAMQCVSLPSKKMTNFQLFLQQKIESKLHDALELKSSFGNEIKYDYAQINAIVDELKKQKKFNEDEMIAIINFYKQSLLQKQVLFTQKVDELVSYLKKLYLEKVNLLFENLVKYKENIEVSDNFLETEDKEFLLHFAEQEFDSSLKMMKKKYAKILTPIMDDFWKTEKVVENEYALDPELLEEKCVELKKIQNDNLKIFVKKIQSSKEKINDIFLDKKLLINDVSGLAQKKVDEIVKSLKIECENICFDLINFNSRFWTKVNARFNSEARRYLVKLNYEYSLWTNTWNKNEKSWMHEYLIINLNQEYLFAVGNSLKDFSPESDLLIDSSKALLQFNEYMREINKNRDLIEYEHLIKLNTIPTVNHEKLKTLSNLKILELKDIDDKLLKIYNKIIEKSNNL